MKKRKTLDKHSHIAMYQQLADSLKQGISSGDFKPLQRLPSEQELVARFGVSRVTVRLAIDQLEKNGLVIRKQGKGTFVTGPFVYQDLNESRAGFDFLRDTGLHVETRILEYQVQEPPAAVARELLMVGLQVLKMVRVFKIDGTPVTVACHYMPAQIARRINRETAENLSAYDLLERGLGLTISRTQLRMRAELAGPEMSKLLDLPPTTPLLVLQRVNFGDDQIPRAHSLIYIRSEAYEVGVTVSGDLRLVATGPEPDSIVTV